MLPGDGWNGSRPTSHHCTATVTQWALHFRPSPRHSQRRRFPEHVKARRSGYRSGRYPNHRRSPNCLHYLHTNPASEGVWFGRQRNTLSGSAIRAGNTGTLANTSPWIPVLTRSDRRSSCFMNNAFSHEQFHLTSDLWIQKTTCWNFRCLFSRCS